MNVGSSKSWDPFFKDPNLSSRSFELFIREWKILIIGNYILNYFYTNLLINFFLWKFMVGPFNNLLTSYFQTREGQISSDMPRRVNKKWYWSYHVGLIYSTLWSLVLNLSCPIRSNERKCYFSLMVPFYSEQVREEKAFG